MPGGFTWSFYASAGIIFAVRFMSPDGDSPVPKGAWILDKLRAGFLSGPFFDCAKIKDFSILKQLSFPHY